MMEDKDFSGYAIRPSFKILVFGLCILGLNMLYVAIDVVLQPNQESCMIMLVIAPWLLYVSALFAIGSLFLLVTDRYKKWLWSVLIFLWRKLSYLFPAVIGLGVFVYLLGDTNIERTTCNYIKNWNLVTQLAIAIVVMFIFSGLGEIVLKVGKRAKNDQTDVVN